MKKEQIIDFLNTSTISEDDKNSILNILRNEQDNISEVAKSKIKTLIEKSLSDIDKEIDLDLNKDLDINKIEEELKSLDEEMVADITESESLLKSLDFIERDLDIEYKK